MLWTGQTELLVTAPAGPLGLAGSPTLSVRGHQAPSAVEVVCTFPPFVPRFALEQSLELRCLV